MITYCLHYFPDPGNSYKLALMLTLCRQEFDGRWLITCKGFHLEAE